MIRVSWAWLVAASSASCCSRSSACLASASFSDNTGDALPVSNAAVNKDGFAIR